MVGGGFMSGGLMGTAEPSDWYSIQSEDITIGAQEGGVAFVALYVSTEPPDKVGGIEFLAQVAADLGVGVAFQGFWSLSGSYGFVVYATTGEEFEASVGVGYTSTTKL